MRVPTAKQLARAHERIEGDYGDPFYRVATALVRLSEQLQKRVSVADASRSCCLRGTAATTDSM